ncbi:hypothetical protein CkaCkLH20_10512 [Colletotrichum karsti]|uniref:Stress-response A/B barrel domain-containing protein n=1 Tax=Colletotrichum karsti TaxID=1095194 RepID=A0A9P6HXE2_9PEZI|nr:uncharacterized protein CkaCkLH20_10512 [Colletotrichum karsti]KAF9871880.1 hypothetical protein CkaCkLH20_10512 [Colletotrichum karsti]
MHPLATGFTFSTGRSASASQSAQKDDEDSIDEKSAAVNDTSVSEKALVKTVARTEYEDRDWVVVPSNPEDEPEEKPEPREVSVRAYAQVARFSTEFKLILFKLKPDVPSSKIDEMRAVGEAMVGVIPGLRSFTLGPPLASTAHRAQGFDMALMTVLDTEEQVLSYAGHPAHQNSFSIMNTVSPKEPPFPAEHQLCTELDTLDDASPSAQPRRLPGYPRTSLHDKIGMLDFLEREHCSSDLDRIAHRLWWMSSQNSANISPLHRQRVKRRTIVITEEAKLHLVWIHDRIFIKPLPRYLTSHAFWRRYLTVPPGPAPGSGVGVDPEARARRDRIRRAALGFLRTCLHLVRYESDFHIAQDPALRLIPEGITWEEFCDFTAGLARVGDHEVSGRYGYGEIRLTRLNFYAPFLLGRSYFQRVEYQYAAYFAHFYGPILFAIGIVSIVLSGLQVAVAVDTAAPLQAAALWFSVLMILGFCSVMFVMFSILAWKIAMEWKFAIRNHVRILEEGLPPQGANSEWPLAREVIARSKAMMMTAKDENRQAISADHKDLKAAFTIVDRNTREYHRDSGKRRVEQRAEVDDESDDDVAPRKPKRRAEQPADADEASDDDIPRRRSRRIPRALNEVAALKAALHNARDRLASAVLQALRPRSRPGNQAPGVSELLGQAGGHTQEVVEETAREVYRIEGEIRDANGRFGDVVFGMVTQAFGVNGAVCEDQVIASAATRTPSVLENHAAAPQAAAAPIFPPLPAGPVGTFRRGPSVGPAIDPSNFVASFGRVHSRMTDGTNDPRLIEAMNEVSRLRALYDNACGRLGEALFEAMYRGNNRG